MSDTLARASSLRVHLTSLYDAVQPGGIAIKLAQEVRVELKRPNKLHARIRRDDGSHAQLWYDGSVASLYDPEGNTYSVLEGTSTLEQMFDTLSDKHGVNIPIADLLLPDPHGAFKEHLLSAAYVGRRMVDGVECHHLSFESRGADFQLWVTADGRALPRRFAIHYVTEPGEPGFLALFQGWELTPYVDDGVFQFNPPPGARKVELPAAAR